ncbi:MAG: fused MFS/spermidine synthase [candidate division KSB1 bacterium]|nr:fused MFS/spermidine synthase [candidate division KSB1 bacterium]MDZ7356231.1 fused MFS/spermidine synthase [candidate division KSB1 bacterium]MDZ7400036.1 fused MFS/spermidine synthase [candidate division KSB1 bacterium]
MFWIVGLSASITIAVWIRQCELLFGDPLFNSIAVLCTFLIGMSAGSYLCGRWIDQKRNELHKFFWIVLLIGVYLLLSFPIFKLLAGFNKLIFHQFAANSQALLVLNTVSIFATFILPAIFIGSLFPILGRFLIQTSDRASREIGNLYGLFAFGVAIGCVLILLLLFPVIGIQRSLLFAAMLYLLCAGTIKFILKQIDPTIHIETEFYNQQLKHLARVNSSRSPFLKRSVMFSIAVFGFFSSSYLFIWHRCLMLIAGDNSAAIYVSLTIFFVGLMLGAFFYPRFLERNNLYSVFGHIQIIIGTFAIISIPLLWQIPTINQRLFEPLIVSQSWLAILLIQVYDASLILLTPTIFMGMAIPLIFKIYLTDYERRGRSFGTIFSANVFGAAVGLLITPLLLIQLTGTQNTLIFLALLNLLIGLVVLLLTSIRYGNLLRTAIAFGIASLMLILISIVPFNLIGRLIGSHFPEEQIVYVKESPRNAVAIAHHRSQPQMSMILNAVKIAETSKESASIQRLCGQLPMLLHKNPESVLVLGFRNGETIANVLNNSVREVDCLEFRTDVVSTAAVINSDRYSLKDHPNLKILPIDGRYYLAQSHKKYDIIINEIAHPAFNGNARFFSLEHFQGCKRHLKPGGIVCGVIPLFKISIEDFKAILGTFLTVFHTASLWYPNNYLAQYAIVIGSSDANFKIDYQRVSNGVNQPAVMLELAAAGIDNSYEIFDSFIWGSKICHEITEGVRLQRDAMPYLEFSCAKTSDTRKNWGQILQLLANYREPIFPYLSNIEPIGESKEMVRLILDNYYKSTELALRASIFELLGDTTTALLLYRKAYVLNRFDRASKRFFDSYFDPMLIDSASTAADYLQNATILYQKMEYEESISQLLKALELNPNYAPAFFGLGINYEAMGEVRKAREMYLKTLRLKPNLLEAKSRLDSLVVGN